MSQNIGQLLTKRAYRDPDLAAIYEPAIGRRLTYSQLNDRSNRVANALTNGGVRPGDRVALLMMNGAEFVESFFAIAKIGGVNVPLNWRLVADELEFILADAGATVLIFSEEFAEVAADFANEETPRRSPRGYSSAERVTMAWSLRRLDGRGFADGARARRLGRRPSVHHVHEWHHGPPEGSDAHPRDRAVGDAHDLGHR